ncbi:helix-turn-helix domain-containing protein [Nocardia tengchongensis]|uniref:helix-turn-helix domain-containing protein n=1 Tax=Nocardia tengchongensis TaxID=2055889 RepID=UPI0036A71607
MLDPLWTPAQLAEYLHTTRATLANDRARGAGPRFVKHGRKVLYPESEIRKYLEARMFGRDVDPLGRL